MSKPNAYRAWVQDSRHTWTTKYGHSHYSGSIPTLDPLADEVEQDLTR